MPPISRPGNPAEPVAADTRRLQMADVARLAGVSVSTVSRALNGSARINAATRKRICDLAQSLRYSIDSAARDLRLKRNRTVAVVLPFDPQTQRFDIDPFAERLLCALAAELSERGYDLLLARVEAGQTEALARLHGTGRALGVLLLGPWRDSAALNELAAHGGPLVAWGAPLPQQYYCSVGYDNAAGARAATRHLLDGGCRRIAFLGDLAAPQVAQRYDGYRQALAEAGQAAAAGLQASVGSRVEDVHPAIVDLLRREPIDGLCAANDMLAMAAISTLHARAVRVPEDVAVVGFDDAELAGSFYPALSTVRQPADLAARELVRALLLLVGGQHPPALLLPPQLIVRASSVRPARRSPRKGKAADLR